MKKLVQFPIANWFWRCFFSHFVSIRCFACHQIAATMFLCDFMHSISQAHSQRRCFFLDYINFTLNKTRFDWTLNNNSNQRKMSINFSISFNIQRITCCERFYRSIKLKSNLLWCLLESDSIESLIFLFFLAKIMILLYLFVRLINFRLCYFQHLDEIVDVPCEFDLFQLLSNNSQVKISKSNELLIRFVYFTCFRWIFDFSMYTDALWIA